jgi:hypothetical protein
MKYYHAVFTVFLFGIVLTGCDDYIDFNVKNTIVEFKMSFSYSDSTQFKKFYENMGNLLQAFSSEYKKFKYKGPQDTLLKTTHLIFLEIDQINLIAVDKYKILLDSINPIIDKEIKQSNYIPVGVPLEETMKGLVQQWIIKGTYTENPIPKLHYHFDLKNIKEGYTMFSEQDDIETFSNAPITPNEQLSQLLAILNGKLRDKLPYFKLKG